MGKKQEDNKIQQLEQKVAELDNQLKRAVADYRNLESRVSQGRSELTSFVGAELVKKLLPVLDHLEQALAGISEEEKNNGLALSERSPSGLSLRVEDESNGWVKGVELAVKEFNQVLAQEGLEQIAADPSSVGTGSQFDPSLHEAVDTGEGEDNKILKVARKGFRFNGKVLRPAGVVVGRKVESGNVDNTDQESNQEPKEEEKN